tara:strand:+ start:1708 stop:4116 length:2409 start_codon:yes stop_codon:yes gene_type:complete
MAFLGGLMRGTSGAFLRGSLDTATDIIQANAVRDEEGIQSRVQGFGAKKKEYDSGIAEFNKQKKLIDSVAQTLSVQDDDFIKQLSPADMEGLAQSLISTSGAKDAGAAIKFFMEHRNDLGAMKIASPKITQASNTGVNEQTNQALGAPTKSANNETPNSFLTAMGKAFSGMNTQEEIAAAAKRMGISVDQYNQVVSGQLPELPSSSVALILNKPDKLSKTISESHSNILSIFRKEGENAVIRPETQIKLSDGTVIEGDKIPSFYMKTYKEFLKDNDSNVDTLYDLQSAIVTASIPNQKVKQYIASFDDELNDMRNVIFNLNVNPEIKEAMNGVYANAMTMKKGFMLNSDTVDMDKAEAYESVIKEGIALMAGAKKDTATGTDKVSPVLADVAKQLERFEALAADPSKNMSLDPSDFSLMRTARDMLRKATANPGSDLVTMAGDIQDVLNRITIASKAPSSGSSDFSQSVAYNLQVLNDAGFEGTPDDAMKIAKHHASGETKIGSTFQEKGYTMMVTLNSDGDVITVPVQTMTQAKGGRRTAPMAITAKATEKIDRSQGALRAVGRLNLAVSKTSNLLGIPGEARIYATDLADFFGRKDLAKALKGGEAAIARANAISFIASAKDELFNDPRLSDKDLQFVTNFVGLLDQPTIGDTRIFAALGNLTRIFTTAQALSMADKFVDMPVIEYKGGFNPQNPIASMDLSKESIGTMVLQNLLSANKMPGAENVSAKVKELQEWDAANGAIDANGAYIQGKSKSVAYIEAIAPYVEMAENAARAVLENRRSPAGFKRDYSTPNLAPTN